MSELNWQTDEDTDWDETIPTFTDDPTEEPTTPSSPMSGRIWLALTLLTIILLGAGWFTFSRVQNRITANIEAIKADVLASHQLTLEAVSQQDQELMANLISGRDLSWVENQLHLVSTGSFFGRTTFGLSQLETTSTYSVTEFSPNLATVTVVTQIAYEAEHTTMPIQLEHTSIYKQGVDRWLLSPPDPLEDAQNETYQGEYIQARYPAEEAELTRRLLADMEQTLQDVCNRFVDLMCSPNTFQIQLSFSPDPAALWAANNPQITSELLLPSPHLLGLPATEQDYWGLYQAYATYINPDFLDMTLREDWVNKNLSIVAVTTNKDGHALTDRP